jgi:site-specific DNA-methyltransferase (adenine-specific)
LDRIKEIELIDEIYNCDCIEGMRELPADSVDAIVTDPPYGLSFMGKEWDHGVPGEQFWVEALRVAKPGAHLLAFGGTRTYHRLACAIEDAGWEVRDCLGWLYGSGFPKSMNVSKAIDKSLGTDAAKQWQGWGTCLKPAWEPIIMARKPIKGTVAACVLEHGTGAINIDACRVGTDTMINQPAGNKAGGNSLNMSVKGMPENVDPTVSHGRFPANIIHDGSEEVLAVFPETGKSRKSFNVNRKDTENIAMSGRNYARHTDEEGYDDSGSAARFFYCAKASKKDRGEGNSHPTVKPQALMQYLIRLVTQEGAIVLDPFLGSGSTAVAAVSIERHYIGYELSPEYFDIARARIEAASIEMT